MKLWPVEHFYNIFVLTFGGDCNCIQQSRPKVRTNMFKKCSTGQRFIFPKWLVTKFILWQVNIFSFTRISLGNLCSLFSLVTSGINPSSFIFWRRATERWTTGHFHISRFLFVQGFLLVLFWFLLKHLFSGTYEDANHATLYHSLFLHAFAITQIFLLLTSVCRFKSLWYYRHLAASPSFGGQVAGDELPSARWR